MRMQPVGHRRAVETEIVQLEAEEDFGPPTPGKENHRSDPSKGGMPQGPPSLLRSTQPPPRHAGLECRLGSPGSILDSPPNGLRYWNGTTWR